MVEQDINTIIVSDCFLPGKSDKIVETMTNFIVIAHAVNVADRIRWIMWLAMTTAKNTLSVGIESGFFDKFDHLFVVISFTTSP
ncbi:MAG: hypothetical protein M1429_02135 [Patescibacteria group bacterium]|nr:hypothetical protein [Patescibacteria group bacterium]